jgi:hypothetical protein
MKTRLKIDKNLKIFNGWIHKAMFKISQFEFNFEYFAEIWITNPVDMMCLQALNTYNLKAVGSVSLTPGGSNPTPATINPHHNPPPQIPRTKKQIPRNI